MKHKVLAIIFEQDIFTRTVCQFLCAQFIDYSFMLTVMKFLVIRLNEHVCDYMGSCREYNGFLFVNSVLLDYENISNHGNKFGKNAM